MTTIARFIVGYWLGRVGTVAVLIVVGLLIVGAQGPTKTPVPAQRAIEQQHRQEAASLAYEDEERERRYRVEPGPPYPTQGWTP